MTNVATKQLVSIFLALSGISAIPLGAQIPSGVFERHRTFAAEYGSALHGTALGFSVAGAGDVDGDGYADVIVGEPFSLPATAHVYSGKSGAKLWQFEGTGDDTLGWSVAGAGDVNGDGYADVFVGAPKVGTIEHTNAGAAYVYSGRDGKRLWQFVGVGWRYHLGVSVAGAGDVDRDGYADVVVGAIQADPGGREDAGSAFVYSGVDGKMLWQFDGTTTGDFLGFSVAGAEDVNQDGFPDVIVGVPG